MISELLNGRYELLDALGEGGMGEVRRARDRLSGREVAVKRVRTSVEGDEARLSLAREFSVLSALRHPNIVSVLDYGFDGEAVPFLAMEIVEGAVDLVRAADKLPGEAKLQHLFQLLRALSYLHARGLVHRDLKPSNVLVAEGHVTVLDFGIASGPEAETHSGGTPQYVAPEVLRGEAPRPPSDLYAVGVMAYEMFAGHHPFHGRRVAALVYQVLEMRPQLGKLPVSPRVANVIGRALAKRPEERFPKASAFLSALADAAGVKAADESPLAREGALRSARFVGRDEELALLDRALADAREGKGSTWLVRGEEGAGKSRLLAELRSRALVQGATVLKGRAVANVGGPFSLFREPVRQLLLNLATSDEDASALSILVPDVAELLRRPVPDPPPMDPGAQLERLSQAVQALFGRIERTTVLQLEDVHLASESLDLLRAVNDIVRTLPLVVVATYRAEEGIQLPAALEGMQGITLSRLDSDHIARLVGSVLGTELDAHHRLVELLKRETEGNALFIVEVLRALGETVGSLETWDAETVPEEVSAGGIREVVRRRVSRLPDPVRRLLAFAGMVGRVVDLDVMRAAFPDEDLEAWLATCAEAAVLEGSEYVWRFAHERLREAAAAMVRGDPADTHRAVAVAMESVHGEDVDWAARLAEHWKRAGEPGKAIHYLMQVSVRMLSSGAPAPAARYAVEAVRLMGVEIPGETQFLGLAIGKEMGEIYRLLGARTPEALVELPAMENPNVAAIIEMLELVKPAAHMSQQAELFALAALKGMALTLEHGAGPHTPDVVGTYAAVSRSMTGDVALAARFSDASLELDRRIHGRVRATSAFLRSWFIQHWTSPLEENVRLAEEGAREGFENGNGLYGCFNASAAVIYLSYAGAEPAEVEAYAARQAAVIDGGVRVATFHCLLERQYARALTGKTRSLTALDDDAVDEARDLASIGDSGNYNQVGYYCATKMRLHLCAANASEALRYARMGEPLRAAFMGQVADWEFTFLKGLASLVMAHDAEDGRASLVDAGREALRVLQDHAQVSPGTFAHKARLLEAEMAALDGRGEAPEVFREAAGMAAEAGFTQDRALALHRLASAHRRAGAEGEASHAARAAVEVYAAWGAPAAADFLRKRFGLV